MRRAEQGNQRRRRMMMGAGRCDGPVAADRPEKSRRSGPRRVYADGALAENQLRLCDLIPVSWWSYVLLLICTGLALYGIAAGYMSFHDTGGEVAEVFALVGTGTIASWLASLLLLVATIGSIQVYLLRRHKLDDYRGHYRMWLVMAGWSCLLSFDAASGSHRLLVLVAENFPSASRWSSASSWWLAVVTLGTGLLGVRLVVEMRRSLPSVLFLVSALAGYGVLLAQHAGWFSFSPEVDPLLISALILLASHSAVTLSIWVYARFCFLRADRRARRTRSDSAHSQRQPHMTRSRRQLGRDDLSVAADASDEDAAGEDVIDDREVQEEAADWEEDEHEDDAEDPSIAWEEEYDEHEEDSHDAYDDYELDEEGYRSGGESLDEDLGEVAEQLYAEQSLESDSELNEDLEDQQEYEPEDEEEEQVAARRSDELQQMLADEAEFDDSIGPEQLRSMSKRQRKKWRRRQRQRRAA